MDRFSMTDYGTVSIEENLPETLQGIPDDLSVRDRNNGRGMPPVLAGGGVAFAVAHWWVPSVRLLFTNASEVSAV
jgi:hypothetical protein